MGAFADCVESCLVATSLVYIFVVVVGKDVTCGRDAGIVYHDFRCLFV